MKFAMTAINQISIMFLIMMIGAFCYRLNLIDRDMNKKLSNLVLLLVNPLIIFASYQREFKSSLLSGLLVSFILALAAHVIGILISLIVLRGRKNRDYLPLERFAVIYSNCGFIGIPLVNGVLGSEGVFYLTSYMTAFNIFAWTHGVMTISGKRDRRFILAAFTSPAIIATIAGLVFFAFGIILPDVPLKTITYIGDMNTPLAMLVAGATIAQSDIRKLFSKARVYYISFIKLLLNPLLLMFLFRLFRISDIVYITVIIACACPTGASINLFSIRYDKDYIYASKLFAVTTILSILTIPLIILCANILIAR